MPLPFRDVTIYNRKQKEWWENMEEIIGLSGYEVNLEQIWRRLCCVLLVILLISGLYYVSGTYEAALSGSGETGSVQKRTDALGGTDNTDLAGENMLLLAEPSNLLDGVTDMPGWKEAVIPKTQEEQVSHTGLLGAQTDAAGNLAVPSRKQSQARLRRHRFRPC